MNDYPKDWKQIAERIKGRARWCCVRCWHRHDPESGHTLTVHHLDRDKANCVWWNLPALCQACHLSVQSRVQMGQAWLFPALHSSWFIPYLAGRIVASDPAFGKGSLGTQCKDEMWVRRHALDIVRHAK